MKSTDNANLIGTWRLLSVGVTFTDTHERMEPYGEHPKGYMVMSQSGRIMFLFGARDRQTLHAGADAEALFREFMAYTGKVRFDGASSFTVSVDYAWNPAWSGDQRRYFELSGNRLVIHVPEQVSPLYGGRMIVGDLTWEREHDDSLEN